MTANPKRKARMRSSIGGLVRGIRRPRQRRRCGLVSASRSGSAEEGVEDSGGPGGRSGSSKDERGGGDAGDMKTCDDKIGMEDWV